MTSRRPAAAPQSSAAKDEAERPPFQIRLWGVRGSLPVAGEQFRAYGGRTICIEMRCGDHVLLFDAGSGMAQAGVALRAEAHARIDLFFTHFHYDHVMGMPFFAPLYDRSCTMTVWSGHMAGVMTTAEMMASFMRTPFFPIGPDICTACLNPREFVPGDTLGPYPGLTIRTALLNHPGNAVGYRVEWGGRVAVVVTDTEHVPGTLDPRVLDLIAGADLVLYDSTYRDEEFEAYRGFGHSTWQQALRLADAAGVQRVGLIHHAEWRTDAGLARIEQAVAETHADAFVGRDDQVIDL